MINGQWSRRRGYIFNLLTTEIMGKVKKILQIIGYIITAILAGWGGSHLGL